MGSPTQTNSLQTIGFAQLFQSAAKVTVKVALFLSAIVMTLLCLDSHNILPILSWYRALPFKVQHPLDFLMLPGVAVWWATMYYTANELVGLVFGFLASTVAYSLLLFIPIVVWKSVVAGAKQTSE